MNKSVACFFMVLCIMQAPTVWANEELCSKIDHFVRSGVRSDGLLDRSVELHWENGVALSCRSSEDHRGPKRALALTAPQD